MEGEARFVGIDVSKAQLDVAVRPTGKRWTLPYDQTGIEGLIPQPKETKERGVNEYYILDGHEPVPASKEEWEAGMKDQKAATAKGHPGPWTVADTDWGGRRVRTVFTGHRFPSESVNPLFFLTQVVCEELIEVGNVRRCNTWDEAVENHHAKVSALQTGGHNNA